MLPLWVVRAFRKFQARFGKGPYAEGSGPGGQTTSKDLQAGVRRANARPTRRGSTDPASTERKGLDGRALRRPPARDEVLAAPPREPQPSL